MDFGFLISIIPQKRDVKHKSVQRRILFTSLGTTIFQWDLFYFIKLFTQQPAILHATYSHNQALDKSRLQTISIFPKFSRQGYNHQNLFYGELSNERSNQ
jgi:hypothetical protein